MARQILLALVLISQSAIAADKKYKNNQLPNFVNIPSETENAWLTMSCRGDPPYSKIVCHFTQVRVHRDTDEVAASNAAKTVAEAAPEGGWDSARRKLCAELKSDAKLKQDNITIALGSPERNEALLRETKLLASFCQCTTDACTKAQVSNVLIEEARRCKITTAQFELTMNRANETTWRAKPASGGLCGISTAYEIKSRDENLLLWTYTQIRLEVKTESDFCDGLAESINKPNVYRWDARSQVAMDCAVLDASTL